MKFTPPPPPPEIPFETENDLRIKGTARTPDVLLSCPVGMKVPKRSSTSRKLSLGDNSSDIEEDIDEEYEWKVVCWIDSKVSLRLSLCISLHFCMRCCILRSI